MDAISEIRERLKKYPDVRAEERPGAIVIHPADTSGFTVGFYADGDSYVVSFDGWHEEFASAEEALNCFAFGLSESCRLRVHRRGGKEYSWTVEHEENGSWKAESTTGLLFFPFWRRLEVVYRRNRLLAPNSAVQRRGGDAS
jgi:hypothetical protein